MIAGVGDGKVLAQKSYGRSSSDAGRNEPGDGGDGGNEGDGSSGGYLNDAIMGEMDAPGQEFGGFWREVLENPQWKERCRGVGLDGRCEGPSRHPRYYAGNGMKY